MDGFLLLLALIVLAIPVSIVVLLVGQSRLRARVQTLEAQIALLQGTVVSPSSVVLQSEVAPVEVPQEVPEAVPVEVPLVVPQEVPVVEGPVVLTTERASALSLWMQRNWIYVVSAASLALAGVFLVQYSVQNGLLPPLARVLAAVAFGLALVAAGERVRRRHGDDEASDTAYLPSVFAGAGIVVLFAATVAARQLYGLIGPGFAFALHLATAGLAVGLGWVYGPLLVAVGLVGAFAAPFLVGSDAGPSALLYGYFALIAAVGLAVDALRRWAWLSVLGLVLAYLGGAAMAAGGAGAVGWQGFLLVLPVLAVLLPPMSLTPDQAGPTVLQALVARGQAGWPPFPVRLVVGAVAVSSAVLALMPGASPVEALLCFVSLTLLAVVLLIWTAPAPGLADMALLPAAGFVLRLSVEVLQGQPLAGQFWSGAIALRAPETAAPMTVTWLVGLAAVISACFAGRALRGGLMSRVNALAAVLVAPVAVAVLELLWAPSLVIGPWVWALHAMGLAAAMVVLVLRFAGMDGADHRRAAWGTLSALSLIALALFLLTSTTALTLALGVLLVTAAALDRRFDLREMGLFIQIGAAVLSWRLLVDPGLDWAMRAPLLAVLLAFAGAIGAEAVGFRLLAGRDRVMTRGVLESAAMALTAVLGNVVLTRWLVPVDQMRGLDLNYVASLNAMPWLVLALTQGYRAGLGPSLRRLRIALAVVAGIFAAIGLMWSAIALNPLFQTYPDGIGARVIGPVLLDTLALSYAMPGLMLLIAALRLNFPKPLRAGLLATGAALLSLYTALEIRRFWQGDWLGAPGVSQYELYSYTVALMLVGAALLYQSIARRSSTLRRVAMAVIAVTVAKVFLIDAAGLTGLTRVFSFLGLGLSLAGLAWLNRWAGKASAE